MHAPNPSLQRERCGNFIICVIMRNEYIKSNLHSEFDVFFNDCEAVRIRIRITHEITPSSSGCRIKIAGNVICNT